MNHSVGKDDDAADETSTTRRGTLGNNVELTLISATLIELELPEEDFQTWITAYLWGPDPVSRDRGYWLRSGIALDGAVSMDDALAWFDTAVRDDRSSVKTVPLSALPDWEISADHMSLAHRTGRFFTIAGFRVVGPDGRTRDQPLILQPEVGVLGFATKVIDGIRHLLVQAKMEPGNPGGIQLSPTVQATVSNYTGVHGGKPVPRLDLFADPDRSQVWIDTSQPEQGAYFLSKYNRNIAVEVDEHLELDSHERWLTVGQVRKLLHRDHTVNMDARTVLSCLPLSDPDEYERSSAGGVRSESWAEAAARSAAPDAPAEHTWTQLTAWLAASGGNGSRTEPRPRRLDRLRGWTLSSAALQAEDRDKAFGVVGVEVTSRGREVETWAQPILTRRGCGLLALVTQHRAGSLHLLVRAVHEPGLPGKTMVTPTVLTQNQGMADSWQSDIASSLDDDEGVLHVDVRHSEEGGRFYRFDYRYLIAELPSARRVPAVPYARWVTVDQVRRFLARGAVSVELRNLLACIGQSATTDRPD